MKKIIALLGVGITLTTASVSYAHCECRERPGRFEHHGQVLLIKEGGRHHDRRVLREFPYQGFEGKHHAWRMCEHEKNELRECRW